MLVQVYASTPSESASLVVGKPGALPVGDLIEMVMFSVLL